MYSIVRWLFTASGRCLIRRMRSAGSDSRNRRNLRIARDLDGLLTSVLMEVRSAAESHVERMAAAPGGGIYMDRLSEPLRASVASGRYSAGRDAEGDRGDGCVPFVPYGGEFDLFDSEDDCPVFPPTAEEAEAKLTGMVADDAAAESGN